MRVALCMICVMLEILTRNHFFERLMLHSWGKRLSMAMPPLQATNRHLSQYMSVELVGVMSQVRPASV